LLECPDEPVSEDGHRPFEQIMRRYAGLVFRVCYNVTRNTHDAEDATQAVFLALYNRLQAGEEIAHMGGWLQQVAYRMSLDFQRGKKRRLVREEVHSAIQDSRRDNCQAVAELDESKLAVTEELDQLPPKYRLPLILHYFGGLSHDEVAREMHCRPGTLRVRLFRARQMLEKRLSNRGVELPGVMLSMTLERIVHNAVTESIIAAARHGSAGWRFTGGLVSAKAKIAVCVGLLTASAMTFAMAQAFGSVVQDLPRRLEEKIENAVQGITQPMMKAVLPPLQASAYPPPAHDSPPTFAADLKRPEEKGIPSLFYSQPDEKGIPSPFYSALPPNLTFAATPAAIISGIQTAENLPSQSSPAQSTESIRLTEIPPEDSQQFVINPLPNFAGVSASSLPSGPTELASAKPPTPPTHVAGNPGPSEPWGPSDTSQPTEVADANPTPSYAPVVTGRLEPFGRLVGNPIRSDSATDMAMTDDVASSYEITALTTDGYAGTPATDTGSTTSTTIVPEPAGLGIAAWGALLLRRRRRKSK
jgi:RNA polymerase sigma factor (sigma-70 family)